MIEILEPAVLRWIQMPPLASREGSPGDAIGVDYQQWLPRKACVGRSGTLCGARVGDGSTIEHWVDASPPRCDPHGAWYYFGVHLSSGPQSPTIAPKVSHGVWSPMCGAFYGRLVIKMLENRDQRKARATRCRSIAGSTVEPRDDAGSKSRRYWVLVLHAQLSPRAR